MSEYNPFGTVEQTSQTNELSELADNYEKESPQVTNALRKFEARSREGCGVIENAVKTTALNYVNTVLHHTTPAEVMMAASLLLPESAIEYAKLKGMKILQRELSDNPDSYFSTSWEYADEAQDVINAAVRRSLEQEPFFKTLPPLEQAALEVKLSDEIQPAIINQAESRMAKDLPPDDIVPSIPNEAHMSEEEKMAWNERKRAVAEEVADNKIRTTTHYIDTAREQAARRVKSKMSRPIEGLFKKGKMALRDEEVVADLQKLNQEMTDRVKQTVGFEPEDKIKILTKLFEEDGVSLDQRIQDGINTTAKKFARSVGPEWISERVAEIVADNKAQIVSQIREKRAEVRRQNVTPEKVRANVKDRIAQFQEKHPRSVVDETGLDELVNTLVELGIENPWVANEKTKEAKAAKRAVDFKLHPDRNEEVSEDVIKLWLLIRKFK